MNHTASAILRQAIGQVFDRVSVKTPQGNALIFTESTVPAEAPQLDEMDCAARDSWRVFHDLCAFSSGDAPLWLSGVTQERFFSLIYSFAIFAATCECGD